jgi:uncharacterized Rossmann fold enzyme
VEYVRWAPWYERIREEFGFSLDRERESADRLLALLPEDAPARPLEVLAPRVAGRDAIVVGLAPGWGAPPIWTLPASGPEPALLAADGAASRCLDGGVVPTIVVTDLDGPVPAEVSANARGAWVVVHAHGDNRPSLDRWVAEFHGRVTGSWAGPPEPRLLDVGGFTDGDRAAYLASALGARRILLWGFDFEAVGDEPAAERPRKRAKLGWARRAIGLLADSGPPPIFSWKRDGTLEPYGPVMSGASTQ